MNEQQQQQGFFGRAASQVTAAITPPADPAQLASRIQTMRRTAIFLLSATAGVGLGTLVGKIIGPSCPKG